MPEAAHATALPGVRIEGSGPVALAFALFLLREGFDASRIDLRALRVPDAARADPGAHKPADGGPRRHLALSEGSCQLLQRVCRLPEGGRIESIEVTLANQPGLTTIRAGDFGLDRLGLVVAWSDLVATLRDALPAHVHASADRDDADDDASRWLVVHAEGAPPERETDTLDFAQSALLAEIATAPLAESKVSTAFERFDRHGPLALLPIGTTRDRYSMVWCDAAAQCGQRAADGPRAIEDALQQAFGARLGHLTVDSAIEVVALKRRRRRVLARDRSVWIGNAAQTLHPVAGQGLNLGVRDAFELARALGDAESQAVEAARVRDPGHVLRTFVASRARDRGMTVRLTDALARAFRLSSLHSIESAALTLLDLAPALRRPLARTLLFGRRA